MGRKDYLGPQKTNGLRNPLLLFVITVASWLAIAYGLYVIF